MKRQLATFTTAVALLAGCATDGCQQVPDATLQAIENGLTTEGGGTVETGQALPYTYIDMHGHLIAAVVNTPGVSEIEGVWLVDNLNEPTVIMSADPIAGGFSEHPTAERAIDFDAQDEVVACLQ